MIRNKNVKHVFLVFLLVCAPQLKGMQQSMESENFETYWPTFRAINQLVQSIILTNQRVTTHLKKLNFTQALPCFTLKEFMHHLDSEEHWSYIIENERALSQSIKDELFQIGKRLEAKFIHVAEPWIDDCKRILSVEELKQWRDSRIKINNAVNQKLRTIENTYRKKLMDLFN